MFSPLVDLEKNSDISSFALKENGLAPNWKEYAPREKWSDPYISVINGDFSKFPPTLIHSGTHDVLLDDSKRLKQKIEKAKGTCFLQLWENMGYGFEEVEMVKARQESALKMAEFFNM